MRNSLRPKLKPIIKSKKKSRRLKISNLNIQYNDLDNYSSISDWEQKKGRGFWGNSNTGYIEDKNNK